MSDVADRNWTDAIDAIDQAWLLIEKTRGNTSRDMNRAIYLAAGLLGIKHREMHRLLKVMHLRGVGPAAREASKQLAWPAPSGFVYFAKTGDGRIKIGFSANPEARIDAVSHRVGIPLRYIGAFRGHMLHEHVTHVTARPSLLGGEWYDAGLLLKQPEFDFLRQRMPEAA